MLKYIDKIDSLRLSKDGLYERTETKLVHSVLKSGQTFVDVGAHIGYYTVMAANLVGENGLVYSFEPEPSNFELLKRNIENSGLSNCHSYQLAVSAAVGDGLLYLSEKNTGDHHIFHTPDRKSVGMSMTMLDRFAPLENTLIDFIKIDVQGAECAVIRGAFLILQRSTNIRMLIECEDRLLCEARSSRKELLGLLEGLGFTVCVKAKASWIPTPVEQIERRHRRGHINLYCYREKNQ